MIRKLHIPELLENERRRITQIAVDLTKRDAYRKCQAMGQCKGDVVGGHLIPKSWLRKICDDEGKVRVFSHLPLNVFKANFEDAPYLPILEHLNNVLVSHFTCEEHEKMFSNIDDPEPDLSDAKNLNLMAYKPIIAGLWREKLLLRAAETELSEDPKNELFQSSVHLQQQRVTGLTYYKLRTEECLNPRECLRCHGGKCKVIAHRVFRVPGKPALAVSDFSDGIRTRINPRFRTVEYIVNWGMTVLPLNDGHRVILHHFVEEEPIIEPMSQQLSRLQEWKLQGEISYRMLKSFENIAIDPRRWQQLGGKRRQAMLDVFLNEMPETGFGDMETVMKWERNRFKPDMPAPNPNQLNLFSSNK